MFAHRIIVVAALVVLVCVSIMFFMHLEYGEGTFQQVHGPTSAFRANRIAASIFSSIAACATAICFALAFRAIAESARPAAEATSEVTSAGIAPAFRC